MSVGHSRRTSRKPSPQHSGASASATCRCASTPSFSSRAASKSIACVTSESTSASAISSRSSPLSLRTTIRPASSSITVGGVIQFSGLYPPASACTSTEPSALTMISRSASGRCAVSRPV